MPLFPFLHAKQLQNIAHANDANGSVGLIGNEHAMNAILHHLTYDLTKRCGRQACHRGHHALRLHERKEVLQ